MKKLLIILVVAAAGIGIWKLLEQRKAGATDAGSEFDPVVDLRPDEPAMPAGTEEAADQAVSS